jgi:hypothetical protein
MIWQAVLNHFTLSEEPALLVLGWLELSPKNDNRVSLGVGVECLGRKRSPGERQSCSTAGNQVPASDWPHCGGVND